MPGSFFVFAVTEDVNVKECIIKEPKDERLQHTYVFLPCSFSFSSSSNLGFLTIKLTVPLLKLA